MKLIQKNGIDILIENKKNTPRAAVCFYFAIEKPEKFSGVYPLFTKLLLQGTKNRSAEQLALDLENNAIEASIKCKQDFFKVSTLFLNEDFELSMEIIKDLLLNSTFETFEKEVYKLKGEIVADLDSPQTKTSDAFIRAIFGDHYYANTHTKTLEELDKIQKQDVLDVLDQLLNARKVISVVGDFEDEEKVVQYFADNYAFMKTFDNKSSISDIKSFTQESKIVKIEKSDAKQAQVIQGFVVDSYGSDDYAKIAVMNNLLGASGLSSRLFVELRDKQGLAYTVRSYFEPLKHSALFYFYIGTEPKNIKKSLEGFKIEVQKLIDVPPSAEELLGAKENIMGRIEYFSQTNAQIAGIKGYDYVMGLGTDFEEKYKAAVNSVTPEDVSYIANKYLNNRSVTTILAPKQFLNM